MDVKQLILDYFEKKQEAVRPGQIAEETGVDKKEIDKAIKSLKKEEKIFSPKQCFYQIKK